MGKNLLDDLWDVGVTVGKGVKFITYKALKIEEKLDLEDFFKSAGLSNTTGEFPLQKKIVDGEKGDLYHMTIPAGLELSNFLGYKQALKEKFNKSVDMKYKDKMILIEVYDKSEEYQEEA